MTIYDDEIDIRPYILILIRHWRQIALLAFVAAAAAMSTTMLFPRKYVATATILLTRSRASLSLAEQFPTVTEPIDSRSRMEALISIAQSDTVIQKTLESLGTAISPELQEPDELKNQVEVSDNGDIILITVSARDPSQAAEIANTWARQAVQTINFAYSGESLGEILTQLSIAQEAYKTAQASLESFVLDNRIQILEKQIVEAQTLFSGQADDRAWQITYYFDRKQSMEDLMVQAEALKRQLQSGTLSEAGALGDALAVLTARASGLSINENSNGFTSQNSLSLELRVDGINSLDDTSASYVADLDALIQLFREENNRSEEILKSLSQEVSRGDGYDTLEKTAGQIRDLEAQLERERSHEIELSSQRDLAWDAYQALAQKETEIKNTAQTSNQVNLASPAVSPQRPAPRGTLRNTLLAGVVGLMIGVGWVFLAQWWQSGDSLSHTNLPSQAPEAADQFTGHIASEEAGFANVPMRRQSTGQ